MFLTEQWRDGKRVELVRNPGLSTGVQEASPMAFVIFKPELSMQAEGTL